MDKHTLGWIIMGISVVVFWVSFFLKRKMLKDLKKISEEANND